MANNEQKPPGKSISETLVAYKILHAMVGPHSEGSLVSADDLGGVENVTRLIERGAIVAV